MIELAHIQHNLAEDLNFRQCFKQHLGIIKFATNLFKCRIWTLHSSVQVQYSLCWVISDILKGVKPRNLNSCQTKYVPGKKKKLAIETTKMEIWNRSKKYTTRRKKTKNIWQNEWKRILYEICTHAAQMLKILNLRI